MDYLDTENSMELKVVTETISRKVLGNPLEKYYVVDNQVRKVRTNSAPPTARYV